MVLVLGDGTVLGSGVRAPIRSSQARVVSGWSTVPQEDTPWRSAVSWVRPPRGLSSFGGCEVGEQDGVDLAGDLAFQAADDLAFGEAFGGAPLYVGSGAFVVCHAGDGDAPEGVVGVAVPGSVQSVALGASR